ncbi:hypothetical protein GR138_01125 [Shinella kummerowiae]|jgi:hypothetical protein|uniref:Uncharacterized protein n=1 Tax=Shinella kummerowiae TaxID=417745 RepID=A0A6N8SAT2_9HYPH|nr:hypothetical protein [Shinella kummerowiae]
MRKSHESLDLQLADIILVVERIEGAGLRTEILYQHDHNARQTLAVAPVRLHGTLPFLLAATENTNSEAPCVLAAIDAIPHADRISCPQNQVGPLAATMWLNPACFMPLGMWPSLG